MSMESGNLCWPTDLARRVGDELVAALEPSCERVCIAGSLRRNKPEVGDIEILYVPRIGQIRRPGALFTEPGSLADDLLEQWLVSGVLAKRLNKNGRPVWGPLNKLARHSSSGISVDFFATTPNRWFVSLVRVIGRAYRPGGNEYRAGSQRAGARHETPRLRGSRAPRHGRVDCSSIGARGLRTAGHAVPGTARAMRLRAVLWLEEQGRADLCGSYGPSGMPFPPH
jgi:hypothetical protein